LMEQLKGRDRELVTSLKFVAPTQNASRTSAP